MKALLQEKWTGFGDGCGSEGECYDVFNSGVPLRLLDNQCYQNCHIFMAVYLFLPPPLF